MHSGTTIADRLTPAAPRPAGVGRAWRWTWDFMRHRPLSGAGGVIVLALFSIAMLAPVVAPHDPLRLFYQDLLQPPSADHPMGTDNLGRDIFSRAVYGARISLQVGVMAVVLGQGLGALLGLLSAYFGGKVDLVMQRLMDTLMAFPALILGLTIVAALGPSIYNIILAVGVVQTPRAARVIRSTVLSVKERMFVDAARAIGASNTRILLRHIAPQVLSPIIVITSIELPHAILIEASLSFLGVGIPEPNPSWGSMIAGAGRDYITRAPWITIFPGVAISLAVFGFNMLGDGLRDVLDPKLRGSENMRQR